VLGIARSGVNALADWMEERGLAGRCADKQDARAWGLYLTARGLGLVEGMKRRVLEGERKRSAALTANERKELLRLLRKLAG
jgi:DNA-binding MarR family transcriptional regulator